VFADIGDEQSIAENLSTFSAHLAAIAAMTRDLARPALVLLDEVGGGTDPTEGGALGVAIVEHFRRAGAMVVVTTHHGLMKAYAQSTPGVEAASFGYDPTSYQPTYRLEIGKPGRSLALEMAERLGLPAEVVQDARRGATTSTSRPRRCWRGSSGEGRAGRGPRAARGLKAEAAEALARARPPSRRSRRRSAARWKSSRGSCAAAPRRPSRRPPRRSAKPSRSSRPRARRKRPRRVSRARPWPPSATRTRPC
jgi:DNA mismatch repair protein MutS2